MKLSQAPNTLEKKIQSDQTDTNTNEWNAVECRLAVLYPSSYSEDSVCDKVEEVRILEMNVCLKVIQFAKVISTGLSIVGSTR